MSQSPVYVLAPASHLSRCRLKLLSLGSLLSVCVSVLVTSMKLKSATTGGGLLTNRFGPSSSSQWLRCFDFKECSLRGPSREVLPMESSRDYEPTGSMCNSRPLVACENSDTFWNLTKIARLA